MPKSTFGGGELIHHVTAIRLRVTGEGELRLFLNSMDSVRQATLLPLTLATATDREPTRLANWRAQRTQLEIRVTEIDEWFRISKIVIFAKQSATSYPG